MLNTNEVAKLLAVAPNTVTVWAQRGLIPAIRLPGKQWRFREEDIKAFLKPNNSVTIDEMSSWLVENKPAANDNQG